MAKSKNTPTANTTNKNISTEEKTNDQETLKAEETSKIKKQDNTEQPTKEEKDQANEASSVKESEEKVEDTKAQENALESKEETESAEEKQEKKRLAKSIVDTPINDPFTAKVIVITSGKGGVGKTTSAASISTGLALAGHKTAVIDFDVGLRNLDLIMGCERRVVYDFIQVLNGEAKLKQALIRDRNPETNDKLYILPASQTKDKEALSYAGVGKVFKELSEMGFEYIICDSPAGIGKGAVMALYYADEAIVTANPEISSIRDSDRVIGILHAKSRRTLNSQEPVKANLLITRYDPSRVNKGEMLSVSDVQELLEIPLVGVIPESLDVLKASNYGRSVILDKESDAGQAYQDAVDRLLGKEVPLRFLEEKKKGFFKKLFS